MSAFVAVSTFLAVLQILVLWSGALGASFDRGAVLLAAGVAAAAALALAARFAAGLRGRDKDESGPLWYRILNWTLGLGALAAMGWCARVWLDLWDLAGRRAVLDWDGLYYHIPAMNGWTLAGRVSWLPDLADLPFANGYPMAVETTTWLLHHVLGNSDRLDAGNLLFWPLGITALAVVARALGARGPWPWLAGGLLYGVPVLVCQSVTCYIDPAYSCTVMGAVAASCLLVFHDGRLLVWRAVLWGLNLGLMAGAKGTGAPFLVTMVLAVVAAVLLREGVGAWRVWWPRLAVAAVLAVAVGGFWYGRNVLETGNPIHPVQVAFGKNVLIPGYDPAGMMADNLPPWLREKPAALRMFIAWTQPDAPVSGYAPTTGLGRIWLLGGLPAVLLLGLRQLRRREESGKALLFLAVLVLLLLVAQPGRWWGRMTVWLHVLGLPALAAIVSYAVAGLRRSILPAPLILAAGLVAVLAARETAITRDHEWQAGRGVPPSAGVEAPFLDTRELFFRTFTDNPGGAAVWESGLFARSRWGRIGTLLGGTLAMPLGARRALLLSDTPTVADLDELRDVGCAWILWDVLGAGEVPEILRAAALEEHAFQPADDVDVRFLRLD
ncbi:MAG: hypothetical protein GY838_14425 [bacterium]|nr:hypothetical protein [bacterium]